jgi:aspartyl-tRNA synthetase
MSRGIGAKGLAYVRWVDEKPSCSFAKFFSEDEISAILNKIGCEKGDTVLIIADKKIYVKQIASERSHDEKTVT